MILFEVICDLITVGVGLPIAMLNPFLWRYIFKSWIPEVWESKPWLSKNSMTHTKWAMLQLVLINLHKMFAGLLLLLHLVTIVNLPNLAALVYHGYRLKNADEPFFVPGRVCRIVHEVPAIPGIDDRENYELFLLVKDQSVLTQALNYSSCNLF